MDSAGLVAMGASVPQCFELVAEGELMPAALGSVRTLRFPQVRDSGATSDPDTDSLARLHHHPWDDHGVRRLGWAVHLGAEAGG